MTRLTDLLRGSPATGLHLVQTDESTLCDRVVALITSHPNAAIRIVRGTKSRTLDAFFDESAAALQFPYYFGENWSAFEEVIGELSSMPAEAYLFVFSSADVLLRDATSDDFRILVETLASQHVDYNKAGRCTFQAVFQCATADGIAAVSARLRAANALFDVVDAG